MKTLQNIYDLMDECNIALEYQDLPKDVLGIYSSNGKVDMIVINQYIESNEMLHRTILAEELGHYFTTIGNNTPKKYTKKRDNLKIDICEERAIRWSLNYLAPTQVLLDYINAHENVSFDDCCNHFGIPRDLMSLRFEILKLNGISWRPNDPETFIEKMVQILTS